MPEGGGPRAFSEFEVTWGAFPVSGLSREQCRPGTPVSETHPVAWKPAVA
jgi:hypothetical protein